MPHNSDCLQTNVDEKACYLRFGPQKVAGAFSLRYETVREETIAIDMTAEGQIVGIELVKPGMKPCQPSWSHQKPLDLDAKPPKMEHPPEPKKDDEENDEEDPGEGNPQQKG